MSADSSRYARYKTRAYTRPAVKLMYKRFFPPLPLSLVRSSVYPLLFPLCHAHNKEAVARLDLQRSPELAGRRMLIIIAASVSTCTMTYVNVHRKRYVCLFITVLFDRAGIFKQC